MTWLWSLLVSIWRWITRPRVKAVTQLTATRIEWEGDMERFRIGWTPSPSLNVDRHEVFVALDGGAAAKVADAIASATSTEILVPSGASVKVFVRTFGDNLTTADSAQISFEATDQTPVKPVSGVTATWLGHEA
jgi:hypothetical protein